MVDLGARQLVNTIALAPGSGVAGAALISDSIAYVSNCQPPDGHPGRSCHRRYGQHRRSAATPQQITFTRGRVLVLNANLEAKESQPARAGSA